MKMGVGDHGDGEVEEEWCVDCSDEETYNHSQSSKGVWEPKAEDILDMFEKLKNEKVLELKWKCPGRRPPEIKKEEPDTDATQDPNTKVEQEPKEDEQKPRAPTEFDFDDAASEPTAMTPIRTPGSKTPRSQKRVARMDKVLQDIMQQRIVNAAEKHARKASGMFSRNPGSPGRARLGSPASSVGSSPRTPPGGTPNRLGGFSTTPVRTPVYSSGLAAPTRLLTGADSPGAVQNSPGTSGLARTAPAAGQSSDVPMDQTETAGGPSSGTGNTAS